MSLGKSETILRTNLQQISSFFNQIKFLRLFLWPSVTTERKIKQLRHVAFETYLVKIVKPVCSSLGASLPSLFCNWCTPNLTAWRNRIPYEKSQFTSAWRTNETRKKYLKYFIIISNCTCLLWALHKKFLSSEPWDLPAPQYFSFVKQELSEGC